jgi:hypothetical protein
MSIETIKVRTTYGDEFPVTLQTTFEYDVPEDLSLALERFTSEKVYDFFKANLIIALQAPARKLMIDAWEALDDMDKARLTVTPEKEGGTTVATFDANMQSDLQEFFAIWTPDTKLSRRAVVRPIDAINVIMAGWDTMTPERQMEMLQKIQQRYSQGTQTRAARVDTPTYETENTSAQLDPISPVEDSGNEAATTRRTARVR